MQAKTSTEKSVMAARTIALGQCVCQGEANGLSFLPVEATFSRTRAGFNLMDMHFVGVSEVGHWQPAAVPWSMCLAHVFVCVNCLVYISLPWDLLLQEKIFMANSAMDH
jgi:hypothetical protein